MSWSGGKDSCLALYEIQKSTDFRVAALLTTVTRDYDRISMHGVRRALLEQQAASLGLPLHQVLITKGAGNEEYETNLIEAVSAYRDQGIDSVVFGDLFLEDIKTYRDQFRRGMTYEESIRCGCGTRLNLSETSSILVSRRSSPASMLTLWILHTPE